MKKRIVIFFSKSLLICWIIFMLIIAFILFKNSKSNLIFSPIILPVFLLISFNLSLAFNMMIRKTSLYENFKLQRINSKINKYGPTNFIALELEKLLKLTRNVKIKNNIIIKLASIYNALIRPELSFDALEQIDEENLFKNTNSTISRITIMDYYLACFHRFVIIDDITNIKKTFDCLKPFIDEFINNKSIQYSLNLTCSIYYCKINDFGKAINHLNRCGEKDFLTTSKIADCYISLKDRQNSSNYLLKAKNLAKSKSEMEKIKAIKDKFDEQFIFEEH